MPSSLVVNSRTVVHKSSQGVSTAFPDVCKTPAAPSPLPIPYPNIAMSSDAGDTSETVTVDGDPLVISSSNFKRSSGDEAGTLGGVVSNTNMDKAEFQMYSFDVKADGKNVPRQLDMMLHNKGGTYNTPPATELQPPNVVVVLPPQEEEPAELTEIESDIEIKEAPK